MKLKRPTGQTREILEVVAIAIPALAVVHYAAVADDEIKSPSAQNLGAAQTARTLAIAAGVMSAIGWFAFLRK